MPLGCKEREILEVLHSGTQPKGEGEGPARRMSGHRVSTGSADACGADPGWHERVHHTSGIYRRPDGKGR